MLRKDFPLAARCFRTALSKGDQKSAFFLGEQYYNGQGVLKNHAQAFKYYHDSLGMDKSEPFYGEALHRIGWCLGVAHGTEKDTNESNRYFKLAYDAGSAKGAENYGWVLFHGDHIRRDTKKGLRIMTQAKNMGVKDVYLDIAYCFHHGIEVEKQSPTKAFKLTKKAYKWGGMWASDQLAKYYASGFGVDKNFDEAARLYHETFRLGGFQSLVAQAYYAKCLVQGQGVKQNVEHGLKMLRAACGEKWSEPWMLLADLYRYGYGVQQNFDTAVSHYNREIALKCGGTAQAHLSLGEMMEAGQGTSGMHHDIYYYYKFAANNFNPIALWKLGKMFELSSILSYRLVGVMLKHKT